MILVLVTAAVVAFIAVRRGGSLEALAATEFAWTSLLFVALLVQVTADLWGRFTPATVEAAVLVLTYTAVAFFLALNRHLPGMLIAAVGMSLNAIVIVVNGAMPVSLWAARIAGVELEGDLGVKHEAAGPHTVLSFLADVIPIPLTLQVVSIGDVVMAVGIAILVYRQTLRPLPQPANAADPATTLSG
ncbi:MAG TPA: DUF5317 domain-containing protein [Actinomycetota bacterium]|nr:DUF5317 domain-containing protein [Actinomycetota bacterium]